MHGKTKVIYFVAQKKLEQEQNEKKQYISPQRRHCFLKEEVLGIKTQKEVGEFFLN